MAMEGYIRLHDERRRRRPRKNREEPIEKKPLDIGQMSVNALNRVMLEKEAKKEDKPEIEEGSQ